MAKLVEGQRRYLGLGFRKTVWLDCKTLVKLPDIHQNEMLQWDEIAQAVRQVHKKRLGAPMSWKVISEEYM